MHGLKIPQQDFRAKNAGGLMYEGGRGLMHEVGGGIFAGLILSETQ